MDEAASEALDIRAPSMVHIPRGFAHDMARLLLTVITRLGPVRAQRGIQALGTMMLHPPRFASQLHQEMRRRLQAFKRGEFGELLASARRAAKRAERQGGKKRGTQDEDDSDEERARLAKRIVAVVHRSGPCKRALSLLSPSAGSAERHEARKAAEKLHPKDPCRPSWARPHPRPPPRRRRC